MTGTDKARPLGYILLAVSGVTLLVYGAAFRKVSVEVPPEKPKAEGAWSAPGVRGDTPQLQAKSEPAVVQDVTLGGLIRDANDGLVKQAYSGEAPAAACPT